MKLVIFLTLLLAVTIAQEMDGTYGEYPDTENVYGSAAYNTDNYGSAAYPTDNYGPYAYNTAGYDNDAYHTHSYDNYADNNYGSYNTDNYHTHSYDKYADNYYGSYNTDNYHTHSYDSYDFDSDNNGHAGDYDYDNYYMEEPTPQQQMQSMQSQIEEMKWVLSDGEAFRNAFNEVFNKFDANNNGLIEYPEIMQVLTEFNMEEGMPAPSVYEVEGILGQFDQNQDGVLDEQEAVIAMRYYLIEFIYESTESLTWFKIMTDGEGYGQLSEWPANDGEALEWQSALYEQSFNEYDRLWQLQTYVADTQLFESKCEDIFTAADLNGDDLLTYDETLQFVFGIVDEFHVQQPSQVDVKNAWDQLKKNEYGQIDVQTVHNTIYKFLYPALIDAFQNSIRKNTVINSLIQELDYYMYGEVDMQEPILEEQYWEGYSHGYSDCEFHQQTYNDSNMTYEDTVGQDNYDPSNMTYEDHTVGQDAGNSTATGQDNYDPTTVGQDNYDPPMDGQDNYGPPMDGQDNYDPTTVGQDNYDPTTVGQDNYDPAMDGQDNYGTPMDGQDGTFMDGQDPTGNFDAAGNSTATGNSQTKATGNQDGFSLLKSGPKANKKSGNPFRNGGKKSSRRHFKKRN